ncbi:MAG: 50S ribosomal protein L25 [Deltaproteobacteria bacterium]|nr:50S ribosomal protein L25 [Deltaproteobacteria bacterium]
MAFPKMSAQRRKETGKGAARKLRAKGQIPGVFYGSGTESIPLPLEPTVLRKLILSSPARSFLLTLKLADKTHTVMLKDFQVHPASRFILHADFLRIEADKAITMEVPLEFVGESEGVALGGILEVQLRYIELSGLPGTLPEVVNADISALNIGDSLKVADLSLPEGAGLEMELETTICSVTAPAAEEEVVAPEEELEEGEEAEAAEEGEAAEEETEEAE